MFTVLPFRPISFDRERVKEESPEQIAEPWRVPSVLPIRTIRLFFGKLEIIGFGRGITKKGEKGKEC